MVDLHRVYSGNRPCCCGRLVVSEPSQLILVRLTVLPYSVDMSKRRASPVGPFMLL